MKTQRLGTSEVEVSRLAYGCMRLSGSWDRTMVDAEVIKRAVQTMRGRSIRHRESARLGRSPTHDAGPTQRRWGEPNFLMNFVCVRSSDEPQDLTLPGEASWTLPPSLVTGSA